MTLLTSKIKELTFYRTKTINQVKANESLFLLLTFFIIQTAPASSVKWTLPETPKAIGNYLVAQQSGNLVFINQIALKDGKVLNPGKLGLSLSLTQGKEATQQTMINVLSVLKAHLKRDLSQVTKVVQLTGFFNTSDDFTDHAAVLNEASNILVDFLGRMANTQELLWEFLLYL